MADMRCLVGLCPDCGRTVVVRPDDEWTCGCGCGLLHLTACTDAAGMADAIELLENVKGPSREMCDRPDGEGAPDVIGELFCELVP